jgi:hypothetical protein
MKAEDRDYYLKRASQEDDAALSAASLTARWRHEELASLYRLRAQQLARTDDEEPSGEIVPAFILAPAPPEIEAA